MHDPLVRSGSHQHPRLSDRAGNYVRELIITGQLKPGEYVRPEPVAVELGVSVTPVREGLLALESEGFLIMAPRRGFVVAPLTRKDVCDAFDAQALLAGELAARATHLVQEAHLDQLEQLQTELEDAASDARWEAVESLNFQFHRTINLLADAPKISWLLRSTLKYATRRFYPEIGGWPEATIVDHRDVIAQLRLADPVAVREAMQRHVRGAGRLLAMHLDGD